MVLILNSKQFAELLGISRQYLYARRKDPRTRDLLKPDLVDTRGFLYWKQARTGKIKAAYEKLKGD